MGIKKETGQNLKAKFSKHTLTQFFFIKKRAIILPNLIFITSFLIFFANNKTIFFSKSRNNPISGIFFKTTIT